MGSVTNEKAAAQERAEALWVANYGWMVRLAWLLTGSQASGQDAVSEAWVRCWHRLGDVTNPVPYLRTAVVNVCLNEKRHTKVVERWIRRQREDPSVPDPADNDTHPELVDALKGLGVRQRSVIVLRYYYSLTDDEIGAALGMKPATVRSNLRHGMKALRIKLEHPAEQEQ